MGNCCHQYKGDNSASEAVTAVWTDHSKCIDLYAFSKAIDLSLYTSSQASYQLIWTRTESLFSIASHEGGAMDYSLKKRVKVYCKKGTPDSMLSRLISKLFRMNQATNSERFSALRKEIRDRPTGQKLFGRKNLSNLFLTVSGTAKTMDICAMVQREVPDLVCCRALPRLIQLLLWYQSKRNVLQIALSLVREAAQMDSSYNTYLFLTEEAHMRNYSRLRKFAASRDPLHRNYYAENDAAMGALAQDMMDNLMLQYIRPERYGHLLGAYLVSGMKIIAKLACVYMTEITKSRAIPAYGSAAEQLFQLQHFCLSHIDFLLAMELAQSIHFQLHEKSLSDSMEGISTERSEHLSKISSHLEAAEALNSFICSQLAFNCIDIVYSSENDGIAMEALMKGWTSCDGPHLVLIFSKDPYVFGVYLDRAYKKLTEETESASSLLQIDPNWHIYPHQKGKKLSVKVSPLAVDIGSGALVLEVPLTDGTSTASRLFSSPSLYHKRNFKVFYIEIWRLKQV